MTRNMTNGKPVKLIVTFALPLMLGNVFQLFYNITDSIILGRYVSSDALAAVGVTSPVTSLIIGFAFGLTAGFAIPVAQAFGGGNMTRVRKLFGNALSLTLIISVIITINALLLSKPLLKLINTPENISNDAKTYAAIMYLGTVFTMFYNVLAGMMRALGDSRAPLLFLIASSVINIILDLVFVIKLNLAVVGVATASVISTAISMILCILYIIKYHKELAITKSDLTPNISSVKSLMNMGLPMALQHSITAIGSLILQGAVNDFGSNAVAAVSVGSKVENIVNIILSGLGVSLSTFVAQNKGANHYSRIFKTTRQIFVIDVLLSVAASALLYFLGRDICTIFVADAASELLNYADCYLKMLAYFYSTLSVLFIYRNALQGLGLGYTSVIAGFSELVGRFLVAYVFSSLLGFTAICLAGPLAWILADIPLVIIYLVKRKSYLNREKIIKSKTTVKV